MYIQYWSRRYEQVSTSYCGSLFVGHCSSDDLVEHFSQFKKDIQLNTSYLLHLGMEGPNVNKSFQEKLSESINDEFLDLGTCPLHTVHNSFKKGVAVIDFDFDEFAVDIHQFFKLSSARREDYRSMEEITEVLAKYAIKHSSTR